jgi:hypothetical protein
MICTTWSCGATVLINAVMIVMGGLSAPAGNGDLRDRTAGLAYRLMALRLDGGKTLKEATWEAAQPYDMRIMGPNCFGTVVPRHRLNASYAHCMVEDGNVACVGQSGVLALAFMDWAKGRERVFLSPCTARHRRSAIEYLADDRHTGPSAAPGGPGPRRRPRGRLQRRHRQKSRRVPGAGPPTADRTGWPTTTSFTTRCSVALACCGWIAPTNSSTPWKPCRVCAAWPANAWRYSVTA